MPNDTQQDTNQHDALLRDHPLFRPIQTVEHSLPPSHAFLAGNLYLDRDGRLIALNKEYRWQGIARSALWSVGGLLAGLAVLEAVYPVMQLSHEGVIGILAGLLAYVILVNLATPKAKGCQSGIYPKERRVHSLFVKRPKAVRISDLGHFKIVSLTGGKKVIEEAINDETCDVLETLRYNEHRNISNQLKDSDHEDSLTRSHTARGLRDTIRRAEHQVTHYLKGSTEEGQDIWIARSKDVDELLSLSAYLVRQTTKQSAIPHETLGGRTHEEAASQAYDTQWQEGGRLTIINLFFLIAIVSISSSWLLQHQDDWQWVYLPVLSEGLSKAILLASLLPLAVRAGALLYRPKAWFRAFASSQRRCIDWQVFGGVMLCILVGITYLGIRLIPIPEPKNFFIVLLLFLALMVASMRRKIVKALGKTVHNLIDTLIQQRQSAQGSAYWQTSLKTLVLLTVLILAATMAFSLLSFLFMSAEPTGGGGKTSVPIYFDLIPLAFLLALTHSLLIQVTHRYVAYLISVTFTFLSFYVALVLTALPILIELPLLVVLMFISLNALISTQLDT